MNNNLKSNLTFGDIQLINFVNLNETEVELVRQWRNHEKIRKWMFTDHIIKDNEHRSFLQGLKTCANHYCWLVKKGSRNIGVIALNKVDFKNKNSFCGLYTNPTSHDIGESVYLFKVLIKVAFEIFGLHSLRGDTLAGNTILYFQKKFGFKIEGKLKDFVLKNGSWKDVFITALINEKKQY